MKTDNALLWEVIESFKWDEKKDYNITPKIVELFGADKTKKALLYARQLKNHLYKVVNDYEDKHDCRCGEYGGDDSFGDMLWHAVGMGKEYYHEVLANPKVLDNLDYTECFGYCEQSFPGGM